MQGASVQCMQATEIECSPGTPSLMVTVRRRFTPQGSSCSFLQAVTQPLQSMQRSVSQMNFMRTGMVLPSPRSGVLQPAERHLGLLHHGHDVVALGPAVVGGL